MKEKGLLSEAAEWLGVVGVIIGLTIVLMVAVSPIVIFDSIFMSDGSGEEYQELEVTSGQSYDEWFDIEQDYKVVNADRSECDNSYPTVCIPPVSVAGDLDCDDIAHSSFKVNFPDPHWFDRDRDGIGCEPWDD